MNNVQRQVIIAGNWKMYKTSQEAVALAEQIKTEIKKGMEKEKNLPEVILIPPFTSLSAVGETIGASKQSKAAAVKLGAQNMDWHDEGAYTGEISPLMLLDLNVQYVLIGHSERRQHFGETNATTNLRLKAALAHDLKPILCVGEMIDERENGLTDAVVGRQVGAALTDIDIAKYSEIVIAYEPVWAIGTGNTCDAVEANRVCGVIRKTVASLCARACNAQKEGAQTSSHKFDAENMSILYGGSVKANNAAEQLKQEHIDGALVGGASLKSEEFLSIIKAAQERVKRNLSTVAK